MKTITSRSRLGIVIGNESILDHTGRTLSEGDSVRGRSREPRMSKRRPAEKPPSGRKKREARKEVEKLLVASITESVVKVLIDGGECSSDEVTKVLSARLGKRSMSLDSQTTGSQVCLSVRELVDKCLMNLANEDRIERRFETGPGRPPFTGDTLYSLPLLDRLGAAVDTLDA